MLLLNKLRYINIIAVIMPAVVINLCVAPSAMAATPAQPPIGDAIERLKVDGGWAVHVGTAEGNIERALAERKTFVVTGLAYDAESEAQARAALTEAGLAGRATVHRVLDDHRLPIVDRSVALLVVSRPGVSDAEVKRVLRPGGVAVIKTSDGWQTIQNPEPSQITEIDGWTHFNYDATASDASRDELAGPIRSVRWMGGHPFQDDKIGPRTAAGVYVSIEYSNDRRASKPDDTIVARDAFSGVVLWRRHGFELRSRYAFVVDDQRVYLHAGDKRFAEPKQHRQPVPPNPRPMVALDLLTGDDAVVYDQGVVCRTNAVNDRHASETQKADSLVHALVVDGRLIQKHNGTLVVLDAATGRKLWQYDTPDEQYLGFIAASAGRVVVTHGPAYHRAKMGYLEDTPIFTTQGFRCFDLVSGKQLWDSRPAVLDKYPHNIRVAVKDGVVAMVGYDRYHNTQLDPVMTVVDLNDGKQLWTTNVRSGATSGGHYPRPQIHRGKVWATGAGGGLGFDLRTGENRTERYSTNFRCSMNRATPNWLIASQNFCDIETGKFFYTEATRGRCDFGMFPANGLVYGSIGDQCGCAAFVRATTGFASTRLPQQPWDGQRMLRGRAGGGESGAYALSAADWPMLLHDERHSSWTDATIAELPAPAWSVAFDRLDPADPIEREWSHHPQIMAPITAPTVLGDTACLAIAHRQTVVAVDTASGKEKWRTPVDGRIDSPPTLAGDSAFVGTRTGWVYALDLATGDVRWRFLAAPHQQLLQSHGQAESAWPVFGSVLLHDGLIWAAAGQQAELDHGIYWYALDPATGAIRRQGRIAETRDWHENFRTPDRVRATNQPLCTDGRYVVFWRSGIDPQTGEQTRFGSTIKQAGTPLENPVNCLVGSGKWGKMREDRGAGYAGFTGNVFAFNGNRVYSVTGYIHQHLAYFHTDEAEVNRRGERKIVERWKNTQKIPRYGCRSLVRAGDALILGSDDGVRFFSATDGKDRGQLQQIKPTIHGIVSAGGRVFISQLDGTLACLE